MPAHWYYKRELIARDYGAISGYLAPRSPHPDSILWRSRYESSCPEDDILHDKAQYWGKPGVHYHQNLEAGENTLSSQLSRLTANSILSIGEYDPEDFLNRYIQFMLSEGSHNDIYIEESHRNFSVIMAAARIRCNAAWKIQISVASQPSLHSCSSHAATEPE